MKKLGYAAASALLLLLLPAHLMAQPADPAAGPTVELPPEEKAPTAGDKTSPKIDMLRGLQEDRFRRAAKTSIGGYGELHANHVRPDEGDAKSTLDMHRLVLFIAHNFNEKLRFYTELEVEHAFVANGKPGQLGLEQGFVDWKVMGESLGIRAGIVLVPMGIVNQWHEPPIFNGVERPMVDKVIIPSTWREGGIGIFGEPMDGLRYELYLVGGLNPMKFSAKSGLRSGRQQVAKARLDALALTGRVEYEPMLGMITGLSAYYSDAGANSGSVFKANGNDDKGNPVIEKTDLSLPLMGASADVRLRHKGLEARAVGAFFSVGNTDDLRQLTDKDGVGIGPDMGSQLLGGYAEVGYDVMRLMGSETDQQLVPFFRYERYDTTFATEKDSKAGNRGITDMVFGLSYRPVLQVVFKANAILRTPDEGDGSLGIDLGVGWMF